MGIVRSVDVNNHAADDLRSLKKSAPEAAATILIVLEQIQADPKAIDKLTDYGDNKFGDHLLNVKVWETARGAGNLWRFRILDSPATEYRVVYGYQWQTQQLCVLAVVHKLEFDYDNLNTEISRRILNDWRSL